jgi:hypothetical protein
MLTCHERYKIALFCGLSPPLDKSRTVVTVRDIGAAQEHGRAELVCQENPPLQPVVQKSEHSKVLK